MHKTPYPTQPQAHEISCGLEDTLHWKKICEEKEKEIERLKQLYEKEKENREYVEKFAAEIYNTVKKYFKL